VSSLLIISVLYVSSAKLPPSWVAAAAWLLSVTTAAVLYRRRVSARVATAPAMSRVAVARWVITAVAVLVVGYVLVGIIFGDGDHSERARRAVHSGDLGLYYLFGYALAVPALEEIAFRGILYDAVLSLAGNALAVTTTTAAFSGVHALARWDLAVLPATLVLGIVLGLARWATRGVTVPIVLHALNNGAILLASSP
jgi:membrane protease YdiL (CAAX protease family)